MSPWNGGKIVPPLYKPPKKILQKGAPKETSTSSNPNPLFFSYILLHQSWKKTKPPTTGPPWENRHGTETTIAQTTPNFVDVLEFPAEKKMGCTPENWHGTFKSHPFAKENNLPNPPFFGHFPGCSLACLTRFPEAQPLPGILTFLEEPGDSKLNPTIFGVGFPLHKPYPYLHFRYLKYLVNHHGSEKLVYLPIGSSLPFKKRHVPTEP